MLASLLIVYLQVCADHENSLLIKLNPVARTSQVQLVAIFFCTVVVQGSQFLGACTIIELQ